MEHIIKHTHRGFAYLELFLVVVFVIALLTVMFGYSGKISKLLKKSSLFTMIFFHLQFLVGIAMLLTSPAFDAILNSGEVMKNLMRIPYNRITFVEHPTSMLIAAILMTVVNKNIKTSNTLNFKILLLSFLALALFLYAFPFDKLLG